MAVRWNKEYFKVPIDKAKEVLQQARDKYPVPTQSNQEVGVESDYQKISVSWSRRQNDAPNLLPESKDNDEIRKPLVDAKTAFHPIRNQSPDFQRGDIDLGIHDLWDAPDSLSAAELLLCAGFLAEQKRVDRAEKWFLRWVCCFIGELIRHGNNRAARQFVTEIAITIGHIYETEGFLEEAVACFLIGAEAGNSSGRAKVNDIWHILPSRTLDTILAFATDFSPGFRTSGM